MSLRPENKDKIPTFFPGNLNWCETLEASAHPHIRGRLRGEQQSDTISQSDWLKLLSCDVLLSDVCSSMALSRVRRMERLRVFARQCGDARTDLLSDARLVSELAPGESLGEACPALVSVMSGFIRRDRDLNCINSRLFPIVFWWNLQPIKAAQMRTKDSPRIPEDQLNKKEGGKKISQCLCHPSSLFPFLLLPLSTPSPLPSVSPCLSSPMVRTLFELKRAATGDR